MEIGPSSHSPLEGAQSSTTAGLHWAGLGRANGDRLKKTRLGADSDWLFAGREAQALKLLVIEWVWV